MSKLVVVLTIVLGVNLLLLLTAIINHFRAQTRSTGWRDPWRWGAILVSLVLGLLAALWVRGYLIADHALLEAGMSPKLDQLKDEGVKFVLYLMTVVALVDVFLLCKYIVNSRLGRVLVAVRDKESRLRFSGYQPYVYKVFIFSVSAMIAGLGGMLYAPQMGIFTPTNMEPKESILVVIWVAVGGRGTLVGPIIGALSVNLLYNYLTGSVPETWPFLLGGLFVAIVLFRPDGLISLKQDAPWFRRAIARFRDYRGRSGQPELWYFIIFSLLIVLLITAGTMLIDPNGFMQIFAAEELFQNSWQAVKSGFGLADGVKFSFISQLMPGPEMGIVVKVFLSGVLIAITTMTGTVLLSRACRLHNKLRANSGTGLSVPEPSRDKATVIALVVSLVQLLTMTLVPQVFAGAADISRLSLFLYTLPASFIAAAVMTQLILPTTFRRGMMVAMVLTVLGVLLATALVGVSILAEWGDVKPITGWLRLLLWAFLLTTLIPLVSISVRRLHDTGRRAWWLLLPIAPVLLWRLCSQMDVDLLALVGKLGASLTLKHDGSLFSELSSLLAGLVICSLIVSAALQITYRYLYRRQDRESAGSHQLSWQTALLIAAAICVAQVAVPLLAKASVSQLAYFADGDLVLSETQTLVTWLDARMGDGNHHRFIIFLYALTVIFLGFLATATVVRFLLKTTFERAYQVTLLVYVICIAVIALVCIMNLSDLLAGSLVLLMLMSIKGKSESNKYGPPPDAALLASSHLDTDLQDQESEQTGGLDITERLQRVANIQRLQTDESKIQAEIVSVHDLTVVFDGFKALDIEHFAVPHYMLQVIIGPNGAGKTTLCDVISGKTRPTTGRVLFNGEDITEASEADIARLGVGRKFQTPTVYDSLSVYQNMELALPDCQSLTHNLFRTTSGDQRDHIHQMLERVRLDDDKDRQVKFLSHGQRQWLEISMLILSNPKLLLVDEPAAGLTDEETVLTAELLLELQEDHSIIVIEHDMEFVRMLSAPVMVLNEGLIMASGTMEEVQADERVVEAYLGR